MAPAAPQAHNLQAMAAKNLLCSRSHLLQLQENWALVVRGSLTLPGSGGRTTQEASTELPEACVLSSYSCGIAVTISKPIFQRTLVLERRDGQSRSPSKWAGKSTSSARHTVSHTQGHSADATSSGRPSWAT